jgi:penicillin-binding protein 1A
MTQSGAALAAPVWGDFMREIHRGLPLRNFTRPSGVYDATVCRISGRTRNQFCNEGALTVPFLAGTGPGGVCPVHTAQGTRFPVPPSQFGFDNTLLDSLSPLPSLPLDLFPDQNPITTSPAPTPSTPEPQPDIDLFSNPFMDDAPPPPPPPPSDPEEEPAIVPRREEDEVTANSDLPSWNPID